MKRIIISGFFSLFWIQLLTAQFTIGFQYTMPLCWGSNTGSIIAEPTGGSGSYTYLWSTAHTTALADSIPGGMYYITVTDVGTSAVVVDSFLLHSPDPIVVHAALVHNQCFGGTQGSILLQVQGGASSYDYTWVSHPTLLGSFVTMLPADMYSVVVMDANGCSVQQSFEIMELHHEAIAPILDIHPVSCRDGINDGKIIIPAVENISGSPTFSFEGALDLVGYYDSLQPGLYSIIITDDNLCSDTFTIAMPMLDVPCVHIYNGFSPNNDGINDVWDIDNIFLFPEVTVKIWNLDGLLLFESEGYEIPWDGTYHDKLIPSSTVYYEVNLNRDIYKPYVGYIRVEY